MTENEAKEWIVARFGVPRGTLVDDFATLLRVESQKQNLISARSFDELWARHFVDSAQLLLHAPDDDGVWVDIGTGAGLPGLVVALLSDRPMVLVEPRARRVEFLRNCAEDLGIADRVTVEQRRIETFKTRQPAAIISARAVSELSQLLASAAHLADPSTLWLLPKGRSAQSEVAAAQALWQGSFHVEPSITSPDSGIVIASGVRPK
ncbi:MAG: 16S rRNA (guanine(527)-N(7))-methyltransferase RsmG [Sphingomonadales bacterium]|nr:MAG: 16S rRNA (guanine(527)-N(7))-methyltransferase RsmG [Sphingomonadales bacterium]